jgi:mRNA surveillance protein pelota
VEQRYAEKGSAAARKGLVLMRILKHDYKSGAVKVRVEHADDLWTLKSVIEPGDTLRGSTERKLKIGSGRDDKAAVVRKRMTLTVMVEKTEYDGSTLRALGTVTDGPEDVPRGEHHSFALEPGEEVTITKAHWPQHLVRKLEDATKLDASVLVVLFDREEAKFYSVTKRGIDEVSRIKGTVAKKGLDEKQLKNFYQEIVQELEKSSEKYPHIVAGAPAFWKEYLEKELPDGLKKKTVMTTISAVEKTAIRELLGRPEVAKLLKESSTLREMALAEEALSALGKEKLAYGWEEIETEISKGNIGKLLVTETLIATSRQDGTSARLETLLSACEAVHGEIHILANDEAMRKIDALGGVVGIRRW